MKPEMDRWINSALRCLAFPPILMGTVVLKVFWKAPEWKKFKVDKKGHDADFEKWECGKQSLLKEVSDLAARESQGRQAIEKLEDQISKRRLEAESGLKDEIASMKVEKERELKERLKRLEEELEHQIVEKRKREMEKVAREAGEERAALLSQVETERNRRIEGLEEELALYKKQQEGEIRAAKEKALAGVMEWTNGEESRLKERLEREYEVQLSSLRGALEKKIQDEFGHIHELFASLADQKKAVAEKDIKEFLDKKLADIVSTIKK